MKEQDIPDNIIPRIFGLQNEEQLMVWFEITNYADYDRKGNVTMNEKQLLNMANDLGMSPERLERILYEISAKTLVDESGRN